jgi:hypothetical protein
MKKNLFGLLIAMSALTFSCTQGNLIPQEETKTAKVTPERFKSMRLKEQLQTIEWMGSIESIKVNNIHLQRVTSGATATINYQYNYNPFVRLYFIGESEDEQGRSIIDFGLRLGATNQVLNINTKAVGVDNAGQWEEWFEINGLKYNFGEPQTVAETEDYYVLDIPLTPTGEVPGTSNDYMNLIKALNNSANGDVTRPELPLNDLKVLSLENVVLRVMFFN